MTNMTQKWVVIEEYGQWKVVTSDIYPWYVAKIYKNLPGDKSGEFTAVQIADAHNRTLSVDKKVTKAEDV